VAVFLYASVNLDAKDFESSFIKSNKSTLPNVFLPFFFIAFSNAEVSILIFFSLKTMLIFLSLIDFSIDSEMGYEFIFFTKESEKPLIKLVASSSAKFVVPKSPSPPL